MNEELKQTRKYIYNHTSQETAKIVGDYPWGFRLRTTIRYWIESKKGHGQRFCSQTINPKTGAWCAPKCSTYCELIVMYLDENEHVKYHILNIYCEEPYLLDFIAIHHEYLNEFQKSQLKIMIARSRVMKNVEFKITPSSVGMVSLFSNDPSEVAKRKLLLEEQEKREKENQTILHKINRAVAYECSKIEL